jgi:hypothetical protein
MDNGRLVRVRKHRGDRNAVSYIVAVADSGNAIELIRSQMADPGDEVEDLGRVSDTLLETLRLGFGQFMRV